MRERLKTTMWLLVVVALAGCGAEDTTDLEAIARGGEAYELYCALCHGDSGEGYVSPKANALTNEDFLVSSSDAFLEAGMKRGRPGTKMSAFGRDNLGPLSDRDVTDIIAYFRSFQEGETLQLDESWVASGDVAAGEALYATQCSLCHGADLAGATALSINNEVFLETASDAFLCYAIESGRRGTLMPAFASMFSAQDIQDLIVYIRSTESGAK